jgi:hypothetical protein
VTLVAYGHQQNVRVVGGCATADTHVGIEPSGGDTVMRKWILGASIVLAAAVGVFWTTADADLRGVIL